MRFKPGLNRIHNVKNHNQNTFKRVLCVCSAGLLRSPTLAEILISDYGYNTRAVGSNSEYALVPIDDALIHWADEIVFVQRCHLEETKQQYKEAIDGKKVVVLSVPDIYSFRNAELVAMLREQYSKAIELSIKNSQA